jgi:PAS domain-containing protein
MEQKDSGQSEWINALHGAHAFFLGVIDMEGHFIFINSKLIKSIHPNLLAVMNNTFYDFVHPSDLESCKTAMIQCCLAKEKVEVRLRLKNGHYRWVNWQITGLNNEGGYATKFLLAGTELKEEAPADTKDALTDRDYEAFYQGLCVGVLFQDHEGTILSANQHLADLLNTTLENIYANPFDHLWKTLLDEDASVGIDQSAPMMALKTGVVQTRVLKTMPSTGKDKRHVMFTAQPVFDSSPQVPAFVVSTVWDLSGGRTWPSLDAESAYWHATLARHSPGLRWVVDQDERLVFANQGLRDKSISPEPKIGMPIKQILPLCMGEGVHEKHQMVLDSNLPQTILVKSMQPNGRQQVFQVTCFPLPGVQGTKLVGGEAIDISEAYSAWLAS